MNLIVHESLAKTVDAVNECLFFSKELPLDAREQVAVWITARHRESGRYANTFALFPEEICGGIRLFTGERSVAASSRHIVGEEACRVLRQLNVQTLSVHTAIEEATQSLNIGPGELPQEAIPRPDDGKTHWLWPYRGGTFCCGACSVGMWRHLLAGGFDAKEARLARGLTCLRDCRKGDGDWRVFPFWYTVLALVEMELPQAAEELRYAARRLESAAQGTRLSPRASLWQARRTELARRALARM